MSPTTFWHSWCWRFMPVVCLRFAHVIICRSFFLILPHFLFPLGCKFPSLMSVVSKIASVQLYSSGFTLLDKGNLDMWMVLSGELFLHLPLPSLFAACVCGQWSSVLVCSWLLFLSACLFAARLFFLLLGKGFETHGPVRLLRVFVYRECVCVCVSECVSLWMHVCVWMCECVYLCWKRVHMYGCVCVCVCVCIGVCVRVWTREQRVFPRE